MEKPKIEEFLKTNQVKEWKHKGVKCYIRLGFYDAPCGYVLFEPKKTPTQKEVEKDVEVHGGVTYFDREKDRLLVGFDTAHWTDLEKDKDGNIVSKVTVEECEEETERLADRLLGLYGQA
jgi:hypothetical protein